LEKAIHEQGASEIELAIRRILLIHGVILTAGGIPLIYLGDEIGTLNDYSYLEDPAHARDSRWVHRPSADWERYEKRNDTNSIEGRIYQRFQTLIALRKACEVFSGGELEVIPTGNVHVLGYLRVYAGKRAAVFANFSEEQQTVAFHAVEPHVTGLQGKLHGASGFKTGKDLVLDPLDFLVIG
jgi:glycosidase